MQEIKKKEFLEIEKLLEKVEKEENMDIDLFGKKNTNGFLELRVDRQMYTQIIKVVAIFLGNILGFW